MKLMAVKVLPLPVAIWISARGLFWREALLEVADRRDLRRPELVLAPDRHELRHLPYAGEEGSRGELGVVRWRLAGRCRIRGG